MGIVRIKASTETAASMVFSAAVGVQNVYTDQAIPKWRGKTVTVDSRTLTRMSSELEAQAEADGFLREELDEEHREKHDTEEGITDEDYGWSLEEAQTLIANAAKKAAPIGKLKSKLLR